MSESVNLLRAARRFAENAGVRICDHRGDGIHRIRDKIALTPQQLGGIDARSGAFVRNRNSVLPRYRRGLLTDLFVPGPDAKSAALSVLRRLFGGSFANNRFHVVVDQFEFGQIWMNIHLGDAWGPQVGRFHTYLNPRGATTYGLREAGIAAEDPVFRREFFGRRFASGMRALGLASVDGEGHRLGIEWFVEAGYRSRPLYLEEERIRFASAARTLLSSADITTGQQIELLDVLAFVSDETRSTPPMEHFASTLRVRDRNLWELLLRHREQWDCVKIL